MATKSKAQLELEKLQKDFENFKKDVATTALQYKQDYGLCDDGFQSFIDDLGLKVPCTELVVKAKVTVNIVGDEMDAEDLIFDAIDTAVDRVIDENPNTFSAERKNMSPFYGAKYNIDSI